MIIQNNQLQDEQVQALFQLCEQAKKVDGGLPMIYTHLLKEPRQANSNLLYYQQNLLLGFLSIYFFYEKACEITLLVHPDYRHRGIAKQLLQTILPKVIAKNLQALIFSCGPSVSLSSLGAHLLSSDYRLIRPPQEAMRSVTPALTVVRATQEDLAVLMRIDEACFPETPKNATAIWLKLVNDPTYTILLAYYQQEPIGKVHLRTDPNHEVILSDLAILPAFQQRGFGNELLADAIRQTMQQQKKSICLDVNRLNSSHALNLYLRHGFKISAQYDYWSVSRHILEGFLANI